MSGNKTHQVQKDILERRIDTSNADEDFDPKPWLKGQAAPEGEAPPQKRDADESPRHRGTHQESPHHKNDGWPEGEKP